MDHSLVSKVNLLDDDQSSAWQILVSTNRPPVRQLLFVI